MFEYPIAIYLIVATFIVLDITTGISQAIYNKTLDSGILRQGMFHKLSYIFAIGLSLALEYASEYMQLGFSIEIFIPLAVYIVITESISVLENIIKLNPELKQSPIFKLLSENQNRGKTDA